MKRIFPAILAMLILLTGCKGERVSNMSYQQITAEQAKTMMNEQPDAVILDVREQQEYDSGHIPNAVLLPVGSITEQTTAEVIPDKETVVLVYCRSGNRSKTASAALVELGYSKIYEFGGIKSWPYEIEQ